MKIELFKFKTDSNEWNYTSSDSDVIYNDDLYTAIPMGRNLMSVKSEMSKSSLEIKINSKTELAKELISQLGNEVLTLTLFIKDDLTINTAWKGRMTSRKPEKNELKINFESIYTSLRRNGLRARYQKNCRHALYNRGCYVDFNNYEAIGLVESAIGSLITMPVAAQQANGYYNGGMIRGADLSFRLILTHEGETLTLLRPFENLNDAISKTGYGINYGNEYGGITTKIYTGCDKLRLTCLNKFNNLDNYGGFPWIPNKNPMDGTSIV